MHLVSLFLPERKGGETEGLSVMESAPEVKCPKIEWLNRVEVYSVGASAGRGVRLGRRYFKRDATRRSVCADGVGRDSLARM